MTTFVDLFGGAGGLSVGLSAAGWTPLLAVDSWADALQTHERNLGGDHTLLLDLSAHGAPDIVAARLAGRRPDWVVGGPPCKGFSTVGRRNRNDPRNRLVLSFADVVKKVQPRQGFVVENVLGLRDMSFVAQIVQHFSTLGFRVTVTVLKSADYGVPQLRRRVVFVGTRTEQSFMPPRATHAPGDYVTVWDAIGDLPELAAGGRAVHYDKEPFTLYQRQMRAGSICLQGHTVSNHPAYLVKAISFIPDGGNRRAIPPKHQPKSGFHNSYSRLHSASPAVAITQNMGKPSATRCIHPFQHRGLTAREGARLQSFPDTFHFSGGIISQREQIANAVPPRLAQVLGIALINPRCWTSDHGAAAVYNGLDDDGRPRLTGPVSAAC